MEMHLVRTIGRWICSLGECFFPKEPSKFMEIQVGELLQYDMSLTYKLYPQSIQVWVVWISIYS